jgi:uncharacterized oxidoreductase
MPFFSASDTRAKLTSLFEAHGVPVADAALVAEELIRAEQMGIHSHGVIRAVQYVNDIESGRVRPGAPVTVLSSNGPVTVLDCGFNLGIVAAHRAVDIALEAGRAQGMSVVATRNCNHVGRLGAYAERCARAGLVCIAAVAIPPLGHFVVPWGGSEGRMGTNPFAFGFPAEPDPIVADFATSVIPEGRIRAAMMNGDTLPPDAVLDADGHVTTDPERFYGPPRGGLLPFGGPAGHKGYALGLLAELLGGALAGYRVDDDERPINAFFMLVLDPACFALPQPVEELGTQVADYMHSSRAAPGHERVLVPGELEFMRLAAAERQDAIEIEDGVWTRVAAAAGEAGITLPARRDRAEVSG